MEIPKSMGSQEKNVISNLRNTLGWGKYVLVTPHLITVNMTHFIHSEQQPSESLTAIIPSQTTLKLTSLIRAKIMVRFMVNPQWKDLSTVLEI